MKSHRTILIILWIFVLMNMIYADILGTLKPGYLDQLAEINSTMSEKTVLLFAIFMEVPIGMIIVTAFLRWKLARVLNIFGTIFSIAWVIEPSLISSLGTTPLSYIFFASIEVISMLAILYLAVRYKPENQLIHD